MNRMFETMTYPFDQRFSGTFYDNSWFKDYDQVEVLSKIKSPTVFIKANTNYDGDLLVAALSDEDANHVVSLLEKGQRIDVDSPGHDIHYDKPEKFIKIVIEFLNELQ